MSKIIIKTKMTNSTKETKPLTKIFKKTPKQIQDEVWAKEKAAFDKQKLTALRKKRDKKLYTTIGYNLKKIREDNQVTRDQLAKMLGVSGQQLYKYEIAKDRISIALLFIVGDYFNVTLNSFFQQEDQQ